MVSRPTSPGQVWLRYRRQGTTLWTNLPAISRAANVGIVSADISGLSPLTSYEVQGSITSSSTLFTRSATFTTPAAVAQMSISFAGALNIQETTSSVVVRVSNVPEGAAPVVSFSVGGRNYSAAATLSQFAGWQVSFAITGLTADTPYSFTVTARAGAQTDTDTVSFTTDEEALPVIFPEVTSLRVADITRTGFNVFASVNLGRDTDGRPFSDFEVVVEWQHRLAGSSSWIPSGRSTVSGSSARATFPELLPLSDYAVRARVIQVRGSIRARGWVTGTARTGKVTRAGINQWRASLADARTALASSRELSQSLNRVVTLLRRMDSDAQDVINAINPGVQVRKLGDVNDSAEELETVAGNLEAQRAELLEDISTYSATTNLAVAALGVGAFGAGGAAIVASTGLIFVGSSAVASFLGAGTLGVTIGAGGTIAIISAAAAAVAAVLLIVTLGVAVVLGVKVLNDKAREVQRDVRPLIPQAETARNQFNSSPASPSNISEAIRETENIISSLEQEILRR